MCAFDALIAAPNATLLDFPILIGRSPGDHTAAGTIGIAFLAYWFLIARWVLAPALGAEKPEYKALVVNNSWGIFHPSLDIAKHPAGRYIDNPNHPFHGYVKLLTRGGVDILFAASNCGGECPSAVCIGETKGMIMGANAYEEVLTLAGCDTYGKRVGYSSQGPAIANMPPHKPDLTAYTHFLGSKTQRGFLPDAGTSAACAVASGCLASIRTRLPPNTTSPATLAQVLRMTAQQIGVPGWNADYGYGIVRPVEAARNLGLIA